MMMMTSRTQMSEGNCDLDSHACVHGSRITDGYDGCSVVRSTTSKKERQRERQR